MKLLVLWDIDGTLIRGSRALTDAFNTALRTVYELDGEPQRVNYGGKTDGQIVLEVLQLHAIEEAAALERIGAFEQRYATLAHAAVDALSQQIVVLPGVREALHAVHAAGAGQTLLTGNLQTTAEIKLRAADLYDAFVWEWGAFGSDDRVRDRLVRIAQRKARAAGFQADHTVVIGDTALDIQCARAGGARAIAVASGTVGQDILAACEPDVILPDLRDTEAVLAAIFGGWT